MVRKIALLFLILTASICCNARTVRILAIGNSFSEDAIEQNLHEIAAAAGDTAIIGNLYIGGCELEKHFYNAIYDSPAYRYRKIDVNGKMTQTDKMTIKDALTDDKWDVVTLQQASHYSGLSEVIGFSFYLHKPFRCLPPVCKFTVFFPFSCNDFCCFFS